MGGSRKRKRGFSGCLAVIVALAVILGGAYFVGSKGFHYLKDHLSSAQDYPGPGHGQVLFQVKSGDTVTQIGRELKAKGVVASVDAFMDASDDKTGHPGRLLPAEEADGRPGRLRRAHRPPTHRHHRRHHPRGAPGQ